MQLVMRSPTAFLLETETSAVQVTTTGGELGIMDKHAPMVAVLAPGRLRYKTAEGWKEMPTPTGVLEMRGNQLLLLVEE